MKRLAMTLATTVFMVGCATGPSPTQRTEPRPSSGQSQPSQRMPGQTEPRPRREQPNVSQPSSPSGQQSQQTPASPQQPSGPSPAQGPAESSPPQQASDVSSPAVMSLLGRADTLAENGNMDDAAATLERALNLEPRNPFIYQRLAAVRLVQNQPGQAEQLAMKSNSLAGGNPSVEYGNWRLIAEARQAAGDTQGASAASSQAASYQQSARPGNP